MAIKYNETGLSDQFVVVKNAVICPPDENGNCGVLDADGNFVEFSQDYIRPRKPRGQPDPAHAQTPALELAGRHMFAGPMHPHFGHFLLESTVRLWILGADAGKLESILFIPIGPKSIWRARKAYRPLLEIFTGRLPIENVVQTTRIEELVIADPGFGHEDRMAASPQYRSFMRDRVAAEITPDGPADLYISRTGLNDNRGGVLGEERIEDEMRAQGYEIYHPQRHSAREQLATYAAARRIVSLDGSALHMVAYALQPHSKLAMILRRKSAIMPRLVNQLRIFSGAEVKSYDYLNANWVNSESRRLDYSSLGELDISALLSAFHEDGFLDNPPTHQSLGRDEALQALKQKGRDDVVRVSLPQKGRP